jgi:hypothetical protein
VHTKLGQTQLVVKRMHRHDFNALALESLSLSLSLVVIDKCLPRVL